MSVGDILERDEDRPAYVRFELRAVKDNEASLKAGHYVSKDEEIVLIMPPYSKDCHENTVPRWLPQLDREVNNGRIPIKHKELWLEIYARWKKGLEPPVNGTSVKDWNAISPAQCQNLINAGCRSIEDLAQVNDEGMRRIGMGANDLKNKAKAWLQAAKDHGPLTEEVTQLKNQNKQLEGTIESLQEQIKRFEIRLDAQDGEASHDFGLSSFCGKVAEGLEKGIPEVNYDLAGKYYQKFGKTPDGRWTDATILKKLQE